MRDQDCIEKGKRGRNRPSGKATNLGCQLPPSSSQRDVHGHQFEHRQEHEEVAAQEKSIDISDVRYLRQVGFDGKCESDDGKNSGNRDEDLVTESSRLILKMVHDTVTINSKGTKTFQM